MASINRLLGHDINQGSNCNINVDVEVTDDDGNCSLDVERNVSVDWDVDSSNVSLDIGIDVAFDLGINSNEDLVDHSVDNSPKCVNLDHGSMDTEGIDLGSNDSVDNNIEGDKNLDGSTDFSFNLGIDPDESKSLDVCLDVCLDLDKDLGTDGGDDLDIDKEIVNNGPDIMNKLLGSGDLDGLGETTLVEYRREVNWSSIRIDDTTLESGEGDTRNGNKVVVDLGKTRNWSGLHNGDNGRESKDNGGELHGDWLVRLEGRIERSEVGSGALS